MLRGGGGQGTKITLQKLLTLTFLFFSLFFYNLQNVILLRLGWAGRLCFG